MAAKTSVLTVNIGLQSLCEEFWSPTKSRSKYWIWLRSPERVLYRFRVWLQAIILALNCLHRNARVLLVNNRVRKFRIFLLRNLLAITQIAQNYYPLSSIKSSTVHVVLFRDHIESLTYLVPDQRFRIDNMTCWDAILWQSCLLLTFVLIFFSILSTVITLNKETRSIFLIP